MFLIKKSEKMEEQVDLPVTAEELETFMTGIIKDFNLPDSNDTRDSICTLIMHMPPSVSKAPLSYFASSVNKSRANAAAYGKLQEYAKLRKEVAEAEKAKLAALPASIADASQGALTNITVQ